MATSAPLKQGSRSFSIPELVALTREGVIRIPNFQRAFVWESEDVRKFFDSLFRGFPVGTILFWQHEAAGGVESIGPAEIKTDREENALWVVDGQQRITSLFASLTPDHRNSDDRFDVYFDLASQKFVNSRRGVPPRRAIPVNEALETRTLLTWLRLHEEELEAEDYDIADQLGGALRDYQLPAYVVTSDDQNLLREIFDRVNSAGKPITRAQVFHALFARDEVPGSPQSVVKELEKLGFGEVQENRVVQSLLAIRGGDFSRDIREEFDSNEDPADWFDLTERALVRVVSFLKSEGVPHSLLMPNAFPIPVLAAFFHLHPEPSTWNLRLLSRWLWRGWSHGFGEESGQTPTLRQAIRLVNPTKQDPASAPDEYEAIKSLLGRVPDREPDPVSTANFKTNERTSRLILLTLHSIQPLGINGEPLDVAGLLDTFGVKAVTQFVQSGRSDAGSRGFWNPKAPPIQNTNDRRVFESHLIDKDGMELLRTGKGDEFTRRRSRDLSTMVHNFLKVKVDAGAILRPPLQDLIVQGETDELS